MESNHNRIAGNSFSGSGQAGLTLLGNGSLVQDNVASHNCNAILIYGDGNVIRGNSVWDNRRKRAGRRRRRQRDQSQSRVGQRRRHQ